MVEVLELQQILCLSGGSVASGLPGSTIGGSRTTSEVSIPRLRINASPSAAKSPTCWIAGSLILLLPSLSAQDGKLAPGEHWALRPVVRPALPSVRDAAWPRTGVDYFILAKLESQGLKPASTALPRQIIRRVSFDLTGLPPTPREIGELENDLAPNAFEHLVDRLLSSPHFGERWARHWLDVARYADNKGYVFFEEKTYPWAWTYRDYVVRAFGEDKPFDRFVLEQLAADQLPLGDDRRSLAAMGFLTVGDHLSNNTHDILDDRIDVVGRGLLGLTVGCARCHAHKFDPISMADYYALYGVFRSSAEPMVPPVIGDPEASEVYEHYELELIRREEALRHFVETKQREIVQGARTRLAEYLETAHAQRQQPLADNFMLLADPGDLNPTVIHRWRVYLDRKPASDPIWAPWHAYSAVSEASFPQEARAVQEKLLAPESARLNPRVRAAFAAAVPASMKDVARRYADILESIEKEHESVAQAAGASGGGASIDPALEELYRVLHGPDAPSDVPAQLDWGFLSLLPDRASQGEFQKLLTGLEGWLMNGPGAPPRAMVLQDLPVPHEPRVFQRGNPGRPGEPVARRFLSAIDRTGRAFEHGSGRLELARAIVDPGNPLTARVLVNRIWLYCFGNGLVLTPSDFGKRSEPPSHPELLDWLADELVRSGWSVKHILRIILGSATYRQSSSLTIAGGTSSVDPENRLVNHANRRRHDFETLRDSLLFVSGTLDDKLGGPPTSLASQRRTLYAFIDRLDVPPVMTTFDVPSPSTSCPQRPSTTVAPQALYLMNNSFVETCAAAILRRSEITSASGPQARVEALYSLLFGRSPTTVDQRRAAEFLGAEPGAKAWESYVHALLMTNEFVFVD